MMRSCCSKRRMRIWSLCLIFFSLSNTILVIASPFSSVKHLCRPDQKDALWEFKNEFYVDAEYPRFVKKTERWKNDSDCCSWDGVSCDPKTGKGLDLGSNNISGVLPDSIGNFKYLEALSLSACKFFGKIPSSLGNLSHLADLYLLSNDFTGELPDSMGNLNRLTVLYLGSTKLRGTFPPWLLNLTELIEIDLFSCQFEGKLPSNMSSLSKLESFSIFDNSFSGSIPSSLFMIPSLIKLQLKRNHFTGLEIGNISTSLKLASLFLGRNNFNGPIPESISKLVRLRELDLSFWNTENGLVNFNIFLQLKSLTSLYLSYLNTKTIVDLSLFSPLMSLVSLDLSGINLKISSTLHFPLPELKLSSCNISEFPKFLQTSTNLTYLDISSNHLKGQVPDWLWSMPKLEYINISQNFFTGFEGSEDVIQTSVTLRTLDISSNAFKDPFPLLPNNMSIFLGADNQFSGEIPRTICELLALRTLVLSNNNFNGSIPRCFQNFNTTLWVLNLRNNSLSGEFPEESISYKLMSFDVGLNRLSGKFPKSLISCTDLEFLNVEDNKINDEFPFWLRLLPSLEILVLRSNEFHGPIYSLGFHLSFPKLRIFDISRNNLTGVLPSDYFSGWSAMSSVVDIVDDIHILIARIYSGRYHKSVGLANKGSNMELVGSSFTIYKTIDISENRLHGNIPESIGLLKELIVLDMSNNVFTGQIPPSLANLSNLQSLDLSQNVLSGKIPPELGKLTFIAWMNFSYNRLEGPIPQGTQIQSQNSSSFLGNPGLCGVPLQETCGGGDVTTQYQDAAEEESDQVISWTAAAISYVPGIVCGLTIGHILNSYKLDWFMRIFPSCA